MDRVRLTDQQIETVCNIVSQTAYRYYPVSRDFFQDLYNTGCRPSELVDVGLWHYVDDDNIILDTLKDNADRYFTSNDLSDSLYFAVINDIAPYDGLTLRQLESVLYKILPYISIQTEVKSAISYVFRYNYVRKLYNAGMPALDIQHQMGWSSTALVYSYSQAAIYGVPKAIEELTSRLIDNQSNYIVDNSGNYITFP